MEVANSHVGKQEHSCRRKCGSPGRDGTREAAPDDGEPDLVSLEGMGCKISDAVSVGPSSPEGSLERHVLNLETSDDGL